MDNRESNEALNQGENIPDSAPSPASPKEAHFISFSWKGCELQMNFIAAGRHTVGEYPIAQKQSPRSMSQQTRVFISGSAWKRPAMR